MIILKARPHFYSERSDQKSTTQMREQIRRHHDDEHDGMVDLDNDY
jgi:hypothetical protein